MTRLVQTGDNEQIELLSAVANLISVRNYLASIYNNTKIEKVLYKRIDAKILALDTQILHLALLIEAPFKIEP